MAYELQGRDGGKRRIPDYKSITWALLTACAAVAAIISIPMGLLIFTPAVFLFVFPIVGTVGTLIGLPFFFIAAKLGRASIGSSVIGGFVAGAAIPAFGMFAGDGGLWPTALLLGVVGMAGGAIFWFNLTYHCEDDRPW